MTVLRRAAVTVTGLARLASAVVTIAAGRRPRRPTRRVAFAGLSAPVEVRHDHWGVPHVYAATATDAFAVQGYLHAADRLWQMEVQRRIGLGRLAEILGPSVLDGDRLVRTLGLPGAARAGVDRLAPATVPAVEAYLRGVNAAIRREPRPVEFRLLGMRPTAWTAEDVLAWTAMMALTLSENWTAEVLRGRLAGLLGEPGADPAMAPRLLRPAPAAVGRSLMPVPDAWTGADPRTGRGSNAWAVTGERAVGGAPLLAADPHLAVTVPGIWYENHLVAPDLTVTGASLPGAPGVVIGHNAAIAWGVTNARVDVQDLYLERLDDTGTRYRTPDGWAEVAIRREEIPVRDAPPHREEVRSTGHGPLVTAFLGAPPTAPATDVALKWAGPEPAGVLDAVVALNRATDWSTFRSAVARWTCPAQNVVYADVSGRVGAALAGTVPQRAQGDGTVPVPGWTGGYEWTGELPPSRRPQQVDPPDGVVVSANDCLVDGEGRPLVGEWVADYRATRIRTLLLDSDRHDVDSFARIQADQLSLPGLQVQALVGQLAADTPVRRAARSALDAWDGRLTADCIGGTVYWALRVELVGAVFADVTEALAVNPGGGPLRWQPGRDYLESVATPVVLDRLAAGDDEWLGAGRTWPDLLAAAWRVAVGGLVGTLGPDVATWQYGRLHRMALRHPFGAVPLLGRRLNRPAVPVGGDLDTVCAGHHTLDSSGDPHFSAATYRMICDLADWDRSRSVLPTGQSGRPGHRHYLDQATLWLRGEYHPMAWSRARVERVTRARTVFRPSTGRRR